VVRKSAYLSGFRYGRTQVNIPVSACAGVQMVY
jgi:hypothetical protein